MRYSYVIFIATLTAMLTGSGAYADHAPSSDRPRSAAYQRCADRSNGVTVAMHNCYADEIGRQDAALNETYKKLIALLEPARKTALQRAERAWIAFRDAECDYQGSANAGGSEGPLDIDNCYIDQTGLRIQVLRNYLATEKEFGDN